MKQLNFFSQDLNTSDRVDCDAKDTWKLYTDGASRNNPGLSGVGFCLLKNDKVVCEQGFFVGTKTNNQAEYLALVVGVFFAQEFITKSDKLAVFADSQLLVRQMNKEYRVKDVQLKKLQAIVFELLQGYRYSFCHVYRQDNKRADDLANRGVDKQVPLPKKLLDLLLEHDVM